jgi:hypothetical protein
MASTSETGNAKNVDNFGELIAGITSFGAKYNPSNPFLLVTALKAKETSARASINAVNSASVLYSNVSNRRENAFKPLNSIVTRALNSLRSSTSTENTDASLAAIARKFYGTRAASTKAAAKKAAAANPEGKAVTVSVSQRSYDSLTDNLDRYVEALASTPEYNPNEEELKIVSLKAFAAELRALNNECNTASCALYGARTARNTELYAPSTGLVDLAITAKTYVKSAFGAASPEYKRIASIKFKTIKP